MSEHVCTLEKMGVPAVGIGTHVFVETMRGCADGKGFPHVRLSFLPQPTSGQPEEIVLAKIRGRDPISGNPFLQQLYDQLTQPLNEDESYTGWKDAEPVPRMLPPDTAENLEELFHSKGWTDGLPIVLPTEERVAAMIAGSNRRPDEIVSKMSGNPTWPFRDLTVEQVAVNAVMAGAKPEHFPVILAIAATGESAFFSSTNSWARMVVVNGPITQEINMSGGLAALGPWNRANSVIGRAYTMISKNLSYAVDGISYMGTQGNQLDYNHVTFAENEELLPEGWDPFHVMKGFAAEESIVSIFAGLHMRQTNRDGWQPLGYQTGAGAAFARAAEMMQCTGPNYLPQATLLIDPLAAANLAREFPTRQEFMQWLTQNSYMNRSEFFRAYPSYLDKARAGEQPYADWLALPSDHRVPVLKFTFNHEYGEPEVAHRVPALNVVVVGGGTNPFWWASNFGHRESVGVDQFRPDTPWAPIKGPEKYPFIPGY